MSDSEIIDDQDSEDRITKICNQSQGLVEASFLRLVNHPGILLPDSIDWCLDKKRVRIQMKKLLTLDQRRPNIDKLLRDIIQVLAYLEVNGVSHNDVKPNNILYDPRPEGEGRSRPEGGGRYILIDFGIASRYERVHQERLGTFYIRAPELFDTTPTILTKTIKDNPSKPRNDVFSLAASIYLLSVGHSWVQSKVRGTNIHITPPDDPEVYPYLVQEALTQKYLDRYRGPHKDLIRRMMNPFPENRPSAVEVAQELGVYKEYPLIPNPTVDVMRNFKYKNSSYIIESFPRVTDTEIPQDRIIKASEAISDLICTGTLPPDDLIDDIIRVSTILDFRLMGIF